MKPLVILGWCTVILSIICAALVLMLAPRADGLIAAGITLALGFLVALVTDSLESQK